jgi:hypothetical protein
MSDLRDARLRKALDSAPDADLRPDPRVRRDILAKAHEAVAPAPAAPWWQRLWQGSGSPGAPWNAAFATIALATLVTVLWHDREVPDARPEAVTASAPVQAPVAAPPATSAAPQMPPPKVAKAPLPAPAPTSQARKREAAQPSPRTQVAQDAAPPAEPLRDAAKSRQADTAAVREEAPRALAKSAAPQAEESRAAAAGLAAAPAVMAPAAAPPARMAAQLRPSPLDGVTNVRGTAQGRAVDLPLEQPSPLSDLLARVIRDARSPELLAEPVDTRVELRRQGELAGVLELAGSQARWTGWRGGAESGAATVRPDAHVLRALRDELGRAAR